MSNSSQLVYLDWAATAPIRPEAYEAVLPFLQPGLDGLANGGGNANSLHTPGRSAFSALERARKDIARAIGASRPAEITFTSGATEANNTAIFGLCETALHERKLAPSAAKTATGTTNETPHFITSAIEHDSVLNAARELEHRGFDVTYLAPDRDGFVQVDAFVSALRPTTVAASIQFANSETGAIQPVRQLAAAAHDAGVIFHTDATQVLGKVFLDVTGLGVDAASISGHKIGALKGTGALYVRKGQAITPLIFGGGQESARRSGTQNVAGAVSFAAAAAQAACELDEAEARMRALRDQIYTRVQDIAGIEALVDVEAGSRDYLPNIVCLATPGIESQTSVLRFDSLGVCVSGGSACASHSLAPSHVLSAMGIDSNTAQCELRVSIGNTTTQADVDAFFDALQQVIDWKF